MMDLDMADIQPPQRIHELPHALVKNMATLAMSGFGVVVALAWNQVIQKFVEDFISPYLGKGSGVISLLIYAIVVTLIAVIVTMQLTNLQKTVEEMQRKRNLRRGENVSNDKRTS